MTLEGFETLYANSLQEREFRAISDQYPNLARYLAPGRWFTALQRSFTDSDAMDEPIFLERSVKDEEYRRGGTRVGAFAVQPAVWLLLLLWVVMRRRFRRPQVS